MNGSLPSRKLWAALIVLLGAFVYAIRVTAPTDLESYAQVLNVGYILDLMTHGHWIVQHDLENAVMSKPPLHTWLMAPFAAIFGLNRLALTLPSGLSVLALALIVFEFGRRRFGELAGGLAAIAIVLAPTMAKQMTLVRTDPFFTLTVALAAFAAFLAWERGRAGTRYWMLFWFAAALTTLIKGPLGLVLAAGGLLSYLWEKRSNPELPTLRGPHFAGIALFLALTLCWFAAAWLSVGQALIDKMLYSELIYHAVGEHRGGWQARDLLKPTGFLLARYLPFSIPFVFALWRVFRHPAQDLCERRCERFLTCWILSGLLIFSVVKHQRADHVLPLWPACALLAGREMARLAERMGKVRFSGVSALVALLLLGSAYSGAHATLGRREGTSDYAQEMKLATDTQLAAEAFIAEGLDAGRLYHVDTPITLQLYMGTYRPFIDRKQLQQILNEADGPVDVALGKTSVEELKLLERYPGTKRLFRWPTDESQKPIFQVYRVAR